MKRLGSSDSLSALMPICPEENSSHVYGREFQSMLMEGLEEEECVSQISEKKRRLSVDQVKALEKNFEMENKLEPERKVKLAQELGLQPRQVAVWFQNRRARWKTKQLERDYGVLKANFDSLKHNYDSLRHDNDSLHKQIRELKAKLYGYGDQKEMSVKEEVEEEKAKSAAEVSVSVSGDDEAAEMIYMVGTTCFGDVKEGSSDSDTSAVLNEDNRRHSCPAEAEEEEEETKVAIMGDAERAYEPQFVKMEEHNFFSGDESCNFFADEQAPTLQWYCQDQWNLSDDN